MLFVISPAKTLDYDPQGLTNVWSEPDFLEDSEELIALLRRKKESDLEDLMGISSKLATLNAQRYHDWSLPFTEDNAKQALLAFKGDVYQGFDLDQWSAQDFKWAQDRVRILSGLYGVLRPLDLMQAYRLEMGTKLANDRGKNLYEFWGMKVTESLNQAIKKAKSPCLVNLASNEYFKVVKSKALDVPVVSPVFKDCKKGKYKIISFYAKKARGMMSDYIIRERAKKPEDLQGFSTAGYYYDADSSTESEPVFLREER